MIPVVIALIVIILIIIGMSLFFFVKYSSNEEKEETYVLLFNRRTRKIMETPLSKYEKNKSWQEIGRIEGSFLDEFLKYLKEMGVYNKFYLNSPSNAIGVLQWYLKKCALEVRDYDVNLETQNV